MEDGTRPKGCLFCESLLPILSSTSSASLEGFCVYQLYLVFDELPLASAIKEGLECDVAALLGMNTRSDVSVLLHCLHIIVLFFPYQDSVNLFILHHIRDIQKIEALPSQGETHSISGYAWTNGAQRATPFLTLRYVAIGH